MKIAFLAPLSRLILLCFSVVVAPQSVVRADTSVHPPTAAGAEENADMNLLASRLLEMLKKAVIKTVAVSRFDNEKKTGHRALSNQLSDSFTSALGNIAGDIHILARPRMLQASQQRKWMSIDLDDSLVFRSIAFNSGADAVIQGTFKLNGKVLELSLKAVKPSNERKIAEVKAKILVPQGMDDSPDAPVQDPVTGVYLSGVGGVTDPTCIHCPAPEFSSEAREKHLREAKNAFRITIRPDGRPADIRLVESAGYGLDENSAAALEHWQFTPAPLPNGTAVPCRVNIETTYRRD